MHTVYICQSEYDALLANTKRKYRYLEGIKDRIRLSPALVYYPDIDTLKEKNVIDNFDKYYDYLLVFLVCWDMFPKPKSEAEAAKRKAARKYLQDIYDTQLVVIDDKEYKAATDVHYETFIAMTDEQKVDALEPLIVNFYDDDFDAFCQMIKQDAPLRPAVKKRTKAKTEADFRNALRAVWDAFFDSF